MLYILLIGLAAGAIAGLIVRGRGYGFLLNLIVGIAGAYIGHWIILKAGIHISGIIGTLFVAVMGAVILLYVLHILKKILDK